MIEVHKRQLEWWKSKFGLSDYGVAWIAFFKGIIFGLLIYHFLITQQYYKELNLSKIKLYISIQFLNYHGLIFNKL